jgi:hypothetical protein
MKLPSRILSLIGGRCSYTKSLLLRHVIRENAPDLHIDRDKNRPCWTDSRPGNAPLDLKQFQQ